jgi:hypothetical protein
MAYISSVFADDRENSTINKKSLIATFVLIANLLTIFAISREILTSYQRDIDNVYAQERNISSGYQDSGSVSKYGQSGYYSSLQYKSSQATIVSLENKSSISLSIFWLIYAIGLLAVGVIGKYKSVRIGGLALLILAILKLFFVDLWSLGTLYRIISSISLGVVLMAISFVYQKYKGVIKEII